MRDFSISVVSFAILTSALWGLFFFLSKMIDFLSSAGLPAGLLWFTAGVTVTLCKPADGILKLCESVYFKVHDMFWRIR
jgi:hypothetical protein